MAQLLRRRVLAVGLCLILLSNFLQSPEIEAASRKKKQKTQSHKKTYALSAKSAVIVDARSGKVYYSKNPYKRLPPASTTKVMTAVLAYERTKPNEMVAVSKQASWAEPSKAGLVEGVSYRAEDLILACLVSSSNDAAKALAEHISGSEEKFAQAMNEKAKQIGMIDTYFINASGLPEKNKTSYTTAYDLTKLLRYAVKNPQIDRMMAVTYAKITGTDAKSILLRSHNKMLWKKPKFVKGKTGWTFESRHTFVGTNYEPDKKITFAMLSSKTPWDDIRFLASHGLFLHQQNNPFSWMQKRRQ